MKRADSTESTLRALKALGVTLAVDDFGTGYSSLSYLRRFPIDALKIDQSFVRQISTTPDETSIVTAVISMGRSLKLRVVAEGVETQAEVEFLKALQCEEAQGFHFSRPVPPERFAQLLASGLPARSRFAAPRADRDTGRGDSRRRVATMVSVNPPRTPPGARAADPVLRLLLVEDSAGDARLIRELITEGSARGIEMAHVATMREAERHLELGAVDVVVLDLGLPDAQGLEAVRRAHGAAPRVPVVVVTGLDNEALAVEALKAGAEDFLVKGQIETRSLQRALVHAVERRALREALVEEEAESARSRPDSSARWSRTSPTSSRA